MNGEQTLDDVPPWISLGAWYKVEVVSLSSVDTGRV
jgi:hypothetical protein